MDGIKDIFHGNRVMTDQKGCYRKDFFLKGRFNADFACAVFPSE